MTPAQSAVIEAAKAWVSGKGDPMDRMAALQVAVADLEMDICEATMEHHRGRLTCCRPNGHTEVRHRDYLRGEWNAPEVPTGNSRTERMER